MKEAIRIIGIDPGLRRTGWGIIETLGNSLRFVAAGTILSDAKLDLASRLCQLHDGLAGVIHEQMPQEFAVEHTFVNKDATATLKLGQARGYCLAGACAGRVACCGVCTKCSEESGDRCRSRREATDPHDGESADAEGDIRYRRCGRCTGSCHMPCTSSAKRDRAYCHRTEIGGTGMIGKLKGTVDEIGEDHVIVDVHGVGYVVYLFGADTFQSCRGRARP